MTPTERAEKLASQIFDDVINRSNLARLVAAALSAERRDALEEGRELVIALKLGIAPQRRQYTTGVIDKCADVLAHALATSEEKK